MSETGEKPEFWRVEKKVWLVRIEKICSEKPWTKCWSYVSEKSVFNHHRRNHVVCWSYDEIRFFFLALCSMAFLIWCSHCHENLILTWCSGKANSFIILKCAMLEEVQHCIWRYHRLKPPKLFFAFCICCSKLKVRPSSQNFRVCSK